MAKVCVGEQNGLERWVAPHLELLAHGSRRFDEMPSAVFVGDAEAHRMADIVGPQISTARSLTTRLRTTPVLGRTEQGHRGHE